MKKTVLMFAALVATMFVYADEEASAQPQLSEAAQEVIRIKAELKSVKADISATKKDLSAKQKASAKVRNTVKSKGAHIIGNVDQRSLFDRRRPTNEDKRLYPTGDIMIVRSKCVCSHFPGGTEEEHVDGGSSGGGWGNSMMNGRSSGSGRKAKVCSQYVAWKKAMEEVEKTSKMIAQLEPLLAEEDKAAEKLAELTAKQKELEAELKAANKAKAAEAAAAAGDAK